MLDTIRYELKAGEKVIHLSNRDMQMLKMLYANSNHITSRRDLLFSVWGDDSYFNFRTLDVYIRKLRKYFSADQAVQVITLKGSGYLFMIP
jgi:DNA-binding response OmpR family regulator